MSFVIDKAVFVMVEKYLRSFAAFKLRKIFLFQDVVFNKECWFIILRHSDYHIEVPAQKIVFILSFSPNSPYLWILSTLLFHLMNLKHWNVHINLWQCRVHFANEVIVYIVLRPCYQYVINDLEIKAISKTLNVLNFIKLFKVSFRVKMIQLI